MKRFITTICLAGALALGLSSCEDYLDKSPDLGLDESTIYADFESIRGYLDQCYPLLTRWNMQYANGMNRAMCPHMITDEMASTTRQNNYAFNQFTKGNWYATTRNANWEVGVNSPTTINNSYKAIRIANRVIANIEKVSNITDDEKNQILGQAYFYRAWYYYQLVTRYGGMPKLDRTYNGGDDNIPRMTAQESFDWLLSDLEQAISMLPTLWDDKNYSRPDKAAAMAVKAQATLYAASPLFQNGLDATVKMPYDQERCLEAAKAAQEVLTFIENNNTNRKFTTCADPATSIDEYRGIFILPTTTFCHEEYLWWDRRKMDDQEQANSIRIFYQPISLDKNTGTDAQGFGAPTANTVKYYERKGSDGYYYPIDDERSGYAAVEGTWEAMKNRDPRFYNNLILPGEEWGKLQGTTYYMDTWSGSVLDGKIKSGNLSSANEFAGWICKKYMWPEASYVYETTADDNDGYALYRIKAFYIRVTEMYLDYAEALFEATGSATAKPEGYRWSAEEAINIVRNRVGVTNVPADYVSDAEKFRKAYRRERTVELMFEVHRWEDIRRWMIFDEVFPTSKCIYNTVWTCHENAKPTTAAYGVPNDMVNTTATKYTFDYEEVLNTVEERVYASDNKYYLYPFPGAEIGSLSNLKQNPGW